MVLSISGGKDSIQLTLNSSSAPDVTTSGTATEGYNVEIRPLSGTEYTLPSRATVTLKINVSNTLGEAAKTRMFKWVTADLEMLTALNDLLSEVTEVTVMYEQGRISADGNQVNFTWQNWNPDFEPRVYKNGILITTGFTIDYVTGVIDFDSSLDSGVPDADPDADWDVVDTINCDYKFSVFTDAQLLSFVSVAIGQFNSSNPSTAYNLTNAPPHALAAAIVGGAYFALNSIVIGFVNQQSRVKWGETEWQALASTLSGNMGVYKERFEFIMAQKKFRLPRSFSIVFPEYSLPGGRQRFTNYLFKHGYDV